MNPEAAVERAFALLDLQRPQEALEHLNLAVAAAPEIPELHCLVALAKLQLKDARGALEAADAAVAHGPEEEWGHRLRAIALIQLGRRQDARRSALESARLAPEAAATHIVLAGALQATGDEAGAVAAARHAVELDPEDGDAHSTLGEILFEQDRPGEAIAAFEAALAINPEDAYTLNNLAVARLRVHDRSGTGRQFEAAARLDPHHGVARHNILHTGRAGRSFVYRRFAVAIALFALFIALAEPGPAAVFLLIAGALEGVRALEVRGLSRPAQELLKDDRRARRFRPHRWDWAWITRVRPWWWVLLTQLPAPLLLALNALLLAIAIVTAAGFWILAFGLALPFSVLRLRRWRRRRHPGAGSWRPPA